MLTKSPTNLRCAVQAKCGLKNCLEVSGFSNDITEKVGDLVAFV